MKFAVVQFPGSNCDQDCIAAINSIAGLHSEYVWHKETSLRDFDAIVLPGALVRNRSLRFVCDMVTMRVEVPDSPFTHGCREGSLLRMPVAHGEGCFFADTETLQQLNKDRQVILRYSDRQGRIVPEANPNGSVENIAGICNRERNVFGLMPHPDRASDERLGSMDGAKIFRSMMETINANRAEVGSGLARQVA